MAGNQEIVVVCTHLCSKYSSMILHRKTATHLLAEFLDGEQCVYVVSPQEGAFPLESIQTKTITADLRTELDFVKILQGIAASESTSETTEESPREVGPLQLQIVYAGFPYVQKSLMRELRQLHAETNSDYTFADGYPIGLTTECLHARALAGLERLAKDVPLTWDTLFTIISRDINAFDIETIVSPKDYRAMHACFTTETMHGYSVCKKLAMQGAEDDVNSVLQLLDADRGILRTIPNYLRIEVTQSFDYLPSYAPLYPNAIVDDPQHKGDIPYIAYDDFASLLDHIRRVNEDAIIEIGSYGEPSKHPNICQLLDLLEENRLTTILVSSGLGWSEESLQYIGAAGYEYVSFAITIEGYDEQSYKIHRNASFLEARTCLLAFHAAYPNNTYVETVRMAEHEHDLLKWYTYWTGLGTKINIRKYNNFNNRLAQRKSADLSPLQRHVCWQLEREMTITCSGHVLQCTQDVDAANVVGNVFSDGLQKTWQALDSLYKEHLDGEYSRLCANCDEYYTFNG